jgi:hypothetical protein
MKHFVILSAILFLGACEPAPLTDETCITIDVVYEAQGVDESFDACAESTIAEDFLMSIEADLELEVVTSSFGNYVAGLMGYNFETLGMSAYWAIYLNDEYAPVGVSELEVQEGDVLLFITETYE